MEVESINIIRDQWLTGIIGRNVYRIKVDDDFIINVSNKAHNDYYQLRELQSNPVFLFAKVPVESLACVSFLEERGFHLIDTSISFEKPITALQEKKGYCDVRFATPDDEVQTVELARKSFKYSRFHMDSFFSKEVANNIKAKWVHSYFLGKRGDALIVALIDKTVVGFLQLIQERKKTLIIDLIAVDSNFRGKGIAKDMIVFSQIHFKNLDYIRAGTQLANRPSVSLYENLCFRFAEANYVFHYHGHNA